MSRNGNEEEEERLVANGDDEGIAEDELGLLMIITMTMTMIEMEV